LRRVDITICLNNSVYLGTNRPTDILIMMTAPENIPFPKAIWWYPGSGSDFFAAVVPYLVQQRWRDEQPPLTVEAPGFLAEHGAFPIVFNDADTSLLQRLEDGAGSEVLYENFSPNLDLVGYSKMEWKQLGMIRVMLERKASFVMDVPAPDPASAPVPTPAPPEPSHSERGVDRPFRTWVPLEDDIERDPRQLSLFHSRKNRPQTGGQDGSSSMHRFKRRLLESGKAPAAGHSREKEPLAAPQRIRLDEAGIPEGCIRVKLMELEVRIVDANDAEVFVQPCWFVLSDVLDFAETVAPVLGTEIKALSLLRTRCSRTYPVRNTDNLGKMVLEYFYRHPDAFKKLHFAWFDGTVRDVRARWRFIRLGKPERMRKPGDPLFEVLVPPRLRDDLATDFLPAWQRMSYWGGTRMGSALHYPAHRYEKPVGLGDVPVFWVIPGLLMGGSWPAGEDREATRFLHEALLDAGIRTFINLVPEKESDRFEHVTNYERFANALARERNIRIKHHAMPMINGGLMLDPEALDDTLAYITREMELGRGVYVHGNDGVGRADTVLAAWLHANRLAHGWSAVKLLQAIRLVSGRDVARISDHQMEFLDGLSPVMRRK